MYYCHTAKLHCEPSIHRGGLLVFDPVFYRNGDLCFRDPINDGEARLTLKRSQLAGD